MLHSSDEVVYYDAEMLSAATAPERHIMLASLISGVLEKDVKASNTAFYLAKDLVGIGEDDVECSVSFETDTSHGILPKLTSLQLIENVDRLQGFVNAIRRWPEQEAVIDVGCGPFPILALAAALYHPRAEISAVEINPKSAASAEEIIRRFGLSDRVQVTSADIANHPIDPNTTAAVTETFNAALQDEPGPIIVRLLHASGVPTITPSQAELHLNIANDKFLQIIDLRQDSHANIAFNRTLANSGIEVEVDISAAYYDDLGLVLAHNTDEISRGLSIEQRAELCRVLAWASSSGQLTYELGSCQFEPVVT